MTEKDREEMQPDQEEAAKTFEEMSVDELIESAKSDLEEAPPETEKAAAEETHSEDAQTDAETGMPVLQFPEAGDLDATRVISNAPKEDGAADEEAEKPAAAAAAEGAESFEPDFGSAFDDYGDYGQPEPENEAELQPAEPEKQNKRKKKRIPILVRVLIYLALTASLGVGLGLFGWECAQDVLALGREDRTVTVRVTDTDTIADVTDTLYSKGLIQHKWLFKLYCSLTKADKKIDPGVYELNNLFDYHALVNGMIESSGSRATVTVMITEGYDCEQIFALLEENGVCSADKLRTAAENDEFDFTFLQDIDIGTSNRLEGYLYPDTYEFYVDDKADNVLNKILKNYNTKMNEAIMAQVEASGYSLRQIMTIASLIEEEAADDAERTQISSVIHNRLKTDNYLQYLQMDSTVFYACQQSGASFDTTIDNPYNTYVYPGLPVGPIDNPGMESIKAALNPAQTDYYYFAAGVDGVSHFFEDFDTFQAFITSDQYAGHEG